GNSNRRAGSSCEAKACKYWYPGHFTRVTRAPGCCERQVPSPTHLTEPLGPLPKVHSRFGALHGASREPAWTLERHELRPCRHLHEGDPNALAVERERHAAVIATGCG